MTLEKLYECQQEYANNPDLKKRLGDWYVKTVEERIAEEEAKTNPIRDPAREERYKKHVLSGRILDPEYAAEHGLNANCELNTGMFRS